MSGYGSDYDRDNEPFHPETQNRYDLPPGDPNRSWFDPNEPPRSSLYEPYAPEPYKPFPWNDDPPTP